MFNVSWFSICISGFATPVVKCAHRTAADGFANVRFTHNTQAQGLQKQLLERIF